MTLAALCMLTVYIALRLFPFGDKTVITGDLGGQYIPFYSYATNRFPFSFSFSKGLGGGTQGLSANIPFSPYMLLLSFLSEQHLPVFFTVLLFAKTVLSVGVMCFYLCSKTKPSIMNILLSLCYALMSYSFIYAQNVMWTDNILILPLILFSLDKLIETRKISLFCGLLALAIVTNYYTAYMICIFSLLYFLWETLGNRSLSINEALKIGLRFVGAGVMAVGISAIIFIPTVVQTLSNKGMGSNNLPFMNFTLREFFRQIIYCGFTWDQVESGLPIVYCGYLCFIGLVIYYFAKDIKRRQKVSTGIILIVFMLSFLIEPLNRVWHAFKPPVWFPYRYSFLFAFFCLTVAVVAFNKITMTKKEIILSTVTVLLCLAIITITQVGIISIKKIALTIILVTCLSSVVFLELLCNKEKLKLMLSILLICIVTVELTANSYYITSLFELRSNKESKEYIGDISEFIYLTESDTFFRMEKDSYISLNDPMLFKYNGLNHFSSVADNSNEDILRMLGYGGLYKSGTYSTAPANALLGLQYIISDSQYMDLHEYQEIAKVGNHTLYLNENTLPFAFYCVKSNVKITDNPFDNLNNIYSSIIGYNLPLFTKVEFTPYEASGQEEGTINVKFSHDSIKEGYYYAYFTPKTDGSSLTIDGKEYGVADINYGRCIIPLGYHNDAFSFTLNTYELEVYVLDDSLFDECINLINTDSPFTKKVDNTRIEIDTNHPGLLVLSMPYYDDWSAKIDGKKIEITKAFDQFLAIEIPKDSSTLTLRYIPRGLTAGTTITILSIIIYFAVIIYEKELLFRKKNS